MFWPLCLCVEYQAHCSRFYSITVDFAAAAPIALALAAVALALNLAFLALPFVPFRICESRLYSPMDGCLTKQMRWSDAWQQAAAVIANIVMHCVVFMVKSPSMTMRNQYQLWFEVVGRYSLHLIFSISSFTEPIPHLISFISSFTESSSSFTESSSKLQFNSKWKMWDSSDLKRT